MKGYADVAPSGGPGLSEDRLGWPRHQALAKGEGGGLHPVLEVQLLEDVLQVVLDGVLGDRQGRGDLLVAPALRHQLEHALLARGQLGAGRRGCGVAGSGG